jgi:nitrite reductase (NADH) small subunit
MAKSYLVGAKNEFSEGSRKVISCDGTEIGVFLVDGKLVAWHNECPHRLGPVCQGRIYKRVLEPVDSDGKVRALAFDDAVTNIVCTWHGYEYDLKTGLNQGSDKVRLRPAKLEEKDGNVYVIV